MTIAPDHSTLAAVPAVDESAVAERTTLLPAREAVLARLAEQLPTTDGTPVTLLIIGLMRRDDGRPTEPGALTRVTKLLANSLRAEDWLGSSGPAEFVIVMASPAVGGRVAADRLVAAIAALEVPGLSAAAGIAPLAAHLDPDEALRRATVTLTAARRVGPGTVVQHREPY
jgi:GGDEF domain-containing protein